MMDQHFKLQHVCEEIQQLNIKVWHVAMHLCNELWYLWQQEEALCPTNPHLAHQISLHWMVCGWFTLYHHHCLATIVWLKGFIETIKPGESLDTGRGGSASIVVDATEPCSDIADAKVLCSLEHNELDEEDEEDVDTEEGWDLLDILSVAIDRDGIQEDIDSLLFMYLYLQLYIIYLHSKWLRNGADLWERSCPLSVTTSAMVPDNADRRSTWDWVQASQLTAGWLQAVISGCWGRYLQVTTLLDAIIITHGYRWGVDFIQLRMGKMSHCHF